MSISTQQLAEILIGVARSQQAIIDAVESMKAGFKSTYLDPGARQCGEDPLHRPAADVAGISGARARAMPGPRGPQP